MVQADRLGPKVVGHLAPCLTHRVNQGELSQCFKHDDSTINIVEVLLLLLLVSEIFSIKVADKQAGSHPHTKRQTDTSKNNKGRLKLEAREASKHNKQEIF